MYKWNMYSLRLPAAALLFCSCAFAATTEVIERGKAEERRSCIACHSTRITHSQRLARGAWEKELDKMARWGSVIKDREALLEYLATDFGDDKPVPRPPLSGDGSKSSK